MFHKMNVKNDSKDLNKLPQISRELGTPIIARLSSNFRHYFLCLMTDEAGSWRRLSRAKPRLASPPLVHRPAAPRPLSAVCGAVAMALDEDGVRRVFSCVCFLRDATGHTAARCSRPGLFPDARPAVYCRLQIPIFDDEEDDFLTHMVSVTTNEVPNADEVDTLDKAVKFIRYALRRLRTCLPPTPFSMCRGCLRSGARPAKLTVPPLLLPRHGSPDIGIKKLVLAVRRG